MGAISDIVFMGDWSRFRAWMVAFGSLLALLSIIAGAVYGMKYLEEGSLGGAISAMFARG